MVTSFSQRVRLSQGGAVMYEKETLKECGKTEGRRRYISQSGAVCEAFDECLQTLMHVVKQKAVGG